MHVPSGFEGVHRAINALSGVCKENFLENHHDRRPAGVGKEK